MVSEKPPKTQTSYFVVYFRNFWSFAAAWMIFTICWAIINIIIFLEPQWIGDTDSSPGTGFYGLYSYCEFFLSGQSMVCQGSFNNYPVIFAPAFKAAAFFIGIAAIFFLCSICCFVLFLFVTARVIFHVCASFQIIATLCLFLGCVIYPAGWDIDSIRRVCGPNTHNYDHDKCELRWAYILALIGIFVSMIISIFGFCLADCYTDKPQSSVYNTLPKSQMNGGYVDDG